MPEATDAPAREEADLDVNEFAVWILVEPWHDGVENVVHRLEEVPGHEAYAVADLHAWW